MSRIKNAKKFRKEFEANKRVIQRFIPLQDIPDEELSDLIDAFPKWEDFEKVKG